MKPFRGRWSGRGGAVLRQQLLHWTGAAGLLQVGERLVTVEQSDATAPQRFVRAALDWLEVAGEVRGRGAGTMPRQGQYFGYLL
ncbi:MAG: hypothetical protein ACKO0U_03420 [Gammaproteobacteria bacterium]